MERAHFAGAALDITVKSDPEGWAERLGATLLPTGSLRCTDPGQVSALPGYAEGAWWVQDAAAALPVQVLAPQPGERVLDLCAAPGGKTLQLATAGAQVTALDLSERRMTRVAENLARTCCIEDARTHQGGPYDAILLDAPCSATGTIRRHPDLPHAKDGSDFGALITLQAEMLDHALTLLKPGGRLVFCTCSLLPDEGECQVEEALLRHPGLRVDRAAVARPGIDPAWITEEGGLRLRPDYWADLGGMDGFYIACLRF
jgi:16S rRNA (cytosine967-C5)-methyltransferase